MTKPKNTPKLIGLTGYAGTGKDTVRHILELRGYVGMAFAEPIRGMLRELLSSNGIDDSYMTERDRKEVIIPALGVSYRHLAQTLGTEWGRSLAPDFWLRIAGAFMDDVAWANHGCQFVVSDVRFENEAAWVKQRGGVIWRIERQQANPVRQHVSETGMDAIECDQVIFNEGTLDELESLVDCALEATPCPK